MTLPDMKSKASLDVSEFRKGTGQMLADLRELRDLGKKVGTLKLTADLSAGKDFQRAASQIRAAVDEMVPTDMQRRVNSMFAGFDVGINSAAQSAQAFEAQAAALRARIGELSNAVRLTRAEFQSGMGDATPEEIANLTANMNRLQTELQQVGQEAKQTFGQWSNEALKAEMATRTAVQTVEAANGRISRLGLASQVKLGASEALAQYSGQANFAANGLFQLALSSDKARIAQGLFGKTVEKTGQDSAKAAQAVKVLQDNLGVTEDAAREGLRGLLRQGYGIEQAVTALKGAGASALAAGRSAQEGMDAYVDAVTSMSSARLNEIGIAENLSTFYQKEAKARGTTVDALTKQQKVQAELNLIMAATGDEVGDLAALMGGAAGQMSGVSREFDEAGKKLGQAFIPLVTNGMRQLTAFLDWFNSFPAAAKNVTAALVVSAVAIGALYGPINLLLNGWKALTTARAAAAGAAAVEAAAETAITGAIVRQNAAKVIQKVLLADVSVLWAKATSTAMLYSGGMNVAAGSTNVLTGSVAALGTTLKTVMAATSIWTIAALAAGAAGVLWGNAVKETTKVYEAMDAANEAAFEKTMARVRELQKSGTELGRAQARMLLLQQQLADAQQGDLVGVNALTGERIYGKPDEARIKQLQADLAKAKDNVVTLYTEAQRRGAANVVLTKEQTEAVKELNKVLDGRKFDLKLSGMSDMQQELAKLGKEFDDLRIKFKQPFIVNGKLLDPAQTPALRDGLAQLDAQLLAEQQATRKRYADEAVKTARESALSVQRAEIEAMRDGAAKRSAQRQLEIDEINRATAEKTKALADFPAQQKQLEEDARKTIAAKRRQWAAEDVALARESAKRVADAEKSARDARIASMADGLRKEEALRAAALADLKASIAEQVKALESDPTAQAGVAAAGREQVAALIAQQNRERLEAVEAVNRQVAEAQQSARSAEIAAIADETQRRRAQREQELAEIRQQTAEKVRSLAGYGQQQVAVQEAARRTIAAKQRQWATEDEAEAKARAQRIADAWARVTQAQFGADQAGRGVQSAQLELRLSRELAAARQNAVQVAQIEAQATQERAKLALQSAEAQYRHEAQALQTSLTRALGDTKLSAQEREALWRGYYADLSKLDSDYQAAGLKRLQEREQAERESAEKIRLARLEQATKPAEAASRDLDRLRFAQGLTESTAEKLALEVGSQAALERQAGIYASVLGRSKELGLTEQERQKYADDLEKANQGILTSQKAQLDYQKQIKGEAKEIVDLYGQVLVLTGTETGQAAAQRELARATTEVGDAYAKALPYLNQFQAGSLKPEQFGLARDALNGLVTALEAQRQKLEALRGEYDKQRDALKSVQDVLKGFGSDLGDTGLLENAIGFNQTTYEQAKTALDTLLKGGKYDAAQLAEATSNLQTAYSGLKDSVVALGEARAKEFEKEAQRIKDESERRTKLLEQQIKAGKDAGLDTSGLERQRDAIVADAERQVGVLEGKAKKARDDAQAALTDRTQGLQATLQGVQQGAATASQSVDALGAQVKKSEQDVKDSAKKMRDSLTGAFSGLPALAGKAGQDAGRQFLAQLQKQLTGAKLPSIGLSGGAAMTRPAVSSITQIITINGQNITGTSSPSMKQLLKALAAEADAECRRRNS